jgi:hypothetical protein
VATEVAGCLTSGAGGEGAVGVLVGVVVVAIVANVGGVGVGANVGGVGVGAVGGLGVVGTVTVGTVTVGTVTTVVKEPKLAQRLASAVLPQMHLVARQHGSPNSVS